MNHLLFLHSMVEIDLQEFVDEIFKVVDSMGRTSIEKAELIAYHLRDVTQFLYT